MNKKDFCHFLILFFICLSSFAQDQIKIIGIIVTDTNKKLENVNVFLKNEQTLKIISYKVTDSTGVFSFYIKSKESKIKLVISSLGYETLSKDIDLNGTSINLGRLELKKNALELKELILESEKKAITIKGDTTIYNVSRFLNGTEESLKDIIKNIPGMKINSNSKIEVNGKVVSELLIDGDNLYKNQHQFATENLSSKIVKSIEFYKNHTPFDKVKVDSTSGDTALNVIIKDQYKNKFKGHVLVENNLNNRYKINSTLYNLNKKNKFSLIQNWNNIGEQPLSIIDYFALTNNEESNNNEGSTVSVKSAETIPKFLRTGENVAQKDMSFFNISNIFSPNKKTKIHFYSILNTASQLELFENKQQFTDNNLNIIENNKNNEKSLFAIFDLKSVYRSNETTVFKISNYVLLDNLNNTNEIASSVNNTSAAIEQDLRNFSKKLENNFMYSKKLKKGSLSNSAFFNYEAVRNTNDINSNISFLNQILNGATFFSQETAKTKKRFGNELNYNLKIKKYNIGIKAAYVGLLYDFENTSQTNVNYFNNYRSRESYLSQGINSKIPLSKKVIVDASVDNNKVFQTIKQLEKEKTNFIGYNLATKVLFTHNSILTISKSLSNSLTIQDNLIENNLIRDYRTVIKNLDLQPNTIFATNRLTGNYLKTNPQTNTFLIINLNHSWAKNHEGRNTINQNNFTIVENARNPRNHTTNFFIYYEKNFQSIPFVTSYNFDVKYSFQDFLINSEKSFFKSTYISNTLMLKSKFKKSPVHFDVGFISSSTSFNTNNTLSKNRVDQILLNTNGQIFKSFFWQTNYSYNNFIVDNNESFIPILSGSLRYTKQNSNWSYYVNAHNILNLSSPVFVSNQSAAGFTSQNSNVILAGYISAALKYKF